MPFVSITRLKVRSIFSLFNFLRANKASARQLILTEGFIAGKELMDKGMTFWTLTIWDNDSGMRNFRNSVPHRKAMQKLPFWCNEASYFHWIQEEPVLPDWSTASARLILEGKITKVRKPSARQIANNFPPIKWTKLEQVFEQKNKTE